MTVQEKEQSRGDPMQSLVGDILLGISGSAPPPPPPLLLSALALTQPQSVLHGLPDKDNVFKAFWTCTL